MPSLFFAIIKCSLDPSSMAGCGQCTAKVRYKMLLSFTSGEMMFVTTSPLPRTVKTVYL